MCTILWWMECIYFRERDLQRCEEKLVNPSWLAFHKENLCSSHVSSRTLLRRLWGFFWAVLFFRLMSSFVLLANLAWLTHDLHGSLLLRKEGQRLPWWSLADLWYLPWWPVAGPIIPAVAAKQSLSKPSF